MYCIKCGVKLMEENKPCPLCNTVPYHPDIEAVEATPLYPADRFPPAQVSPKGALIVISTIVFLMPMVITLLCDLQISGQVTWSGYVIGALLSLYVMCVLPYWFRKPNPVVFVPCGFAAVGVYLLYINLATGGAWFLSFALPIVGWIGLVVTAVVTLLRYVKRGVLYIIGGAQIAIGAFMPVMELLLNITFHRPMVFLWSVYPLAALVLLGGMLIFLAIYRPARETMERKFFL